MSSDATLLRLPWENEANTTTVWRLRFDGTAYGEQSFSVYFTDAVVTSNILTVWRALQVAWGGAGLHADELEDHAQEIIWWLQERDAIPMGVRTIFTLLAYGDLTFDALAVNA